MAIMIEGFLGKSKSPQKPPLLSSAQSSLCLANCPKDVKRQVICGTRSLVTEISKLIHNWGASIMCLANLLAIGGQHALVAERLGEDLKQGSLFVFSNRRHTRLKIIYRDAHA